MGYWDKSKYQIIWLHFKGKQKIKVITVSSSLYLIKYQRLEYILLSMKL